MLNQAGAKMILSVLKQVDPEPDMAQLEFGQFIKEQTLPSLNKSSQTKLKQMCLIRLDFNKPN